MQRHYRVAPGVDSHSVGTERVSKDTMMYSLGRLTVTVALTLSSLMAVGCASEVDEEYGTEGEDIRVAGTFTAKSSAYFPDDSEMEGGFKDMRGKPLQTLQGFLKGKNKYVSVAMDKGVFKYGQRLRIREVNERYGKEVVFRVVDTGGAFYGKGRSRIDLCVANETLSFEKIVNSKLTIDVIDETKPDQDTTNTPQPPPDNSGSSTAPGADTYCRGDGDCNPGNNGSGKICVSKRCVAGCKNDNMCPGVQKCTSGMCQ
jgi:3D (Asp-Asp-Asp) domain-containing protein